MDWNQAIERGDRIEPQRRILDRCEATKPQHALAILRQLIVPRGVDRRDCGHRRGQADPALWSADVVMIAQLDRLGWRECMMPRVAGAGALGHGKRGMNRARPIAVQDVAMIGVQTWQAKMSARESTKYAGLRGVGVHDVWRKLAQLLDEIIERTQVIKRRDTTAKAGELFN